MNVHLTNPTPRTWRRRKSRAAASYRPRTRRLRSASETEPSQNPAESRTFPEPSRSPDESSLPRSPNGGGGSRGRTGLSQRFPEKAGKIQGIFVDSEPSSAMTSEISPSFRPVGNEFLKTQNRECSRRTMEYLDTNRESKLSVPWTNAHREEMPVQRFSRGNGLCPNFTPP